MSFNCTTKPIAIGPKLIQVPTHMAITNKPKIVDFTEVDIYPSNYKYLDGKVTIKSFIIENIERQKEVLAKMNTTVLVGDCIKVDIKFGHFENGGWIDLYAKGIYKVKKITPLKSTCEILLLVTSTV